MSFSRNPEFTVWQTATAHELAIKAELLQLQDDFSIMKFGKDDWKLNSSIVVRLASYTKSAYVTIVKYVNGRDYEVAKIRISDHSAYTAKQQQHLYGYNDLTVESIRSIVSELVANAKQN